VGDAREAVGQLAVDGEPSAPRGGSQEISREVPADPVRGEYDR
jgi:hypothetical protein